MSKKLNAKFFLVYLSTLALLATGLRVLSSGPGNTFFVYAFLVLAILLWFVIEIYKKVYIFSSSVLTRCDELEELLFDIRNGTRRFYREKRRFRRIDAKDKISAKIANKDAGSFFNILNVSHAGALLRSCQDIFSAGEKLDLSMYLPYFPQPIGVRSKVVRVDHTSPEKADDFDVGVEYLNMTSIDREKLTETINLLDNDPLKKEQFASF
ncbi:MAG: hypothetical protein A2Z72_07310 [Omnitrophica bacterium RBG_13_46_9]|nr:MAG: hypothetical protein A2Z72_07310 [Omnitrophica bacterium RBG_13_46_9]